jgi:hypothetical protein
MVRPPSGRSRVVRHHDAGPRGEGSRGGPLPCDGRHACGVRGSSSGETGWRSWACLEEKQGRERRPNFSRRFCRRAGGRSDRRSRQVHNIGRSDRRSRQVYDFKGNTPISHLIHEARLPACETGEHPSAKPPPRAARGRPTFALSTRNPVQARLPLVRRPWAAPRRSSPSRRKIRPTLAASAPEDPTDVGGKCMILKETRPFDVSFLRRDFSPARHTATLPRPAELTGADDPRTHED